MRSSLKSALRWIATVAAVFIVPALVMEAVLSAFAIGSLDRDAARFLIYLVGLQLTISLAFILEWRLASAKTLSGLTAGVKASLDSNIRNSIDSGIVGHFIDRRNGSAVSEIFAHVATVLLDRLKDRPAELLEACSPFIEAEIALALQHVDDSLGAGAKVDIAEHLRVTRYLCDRSTSYLQIQRRAFSVPEEWTREWVAFIEEMSRKNIIKTYIVLAPVAELKADSAKLDSMKKYLRARGFRFGTCNFHEVADVTGGGVPKGVIEVFGNGIIKIAELPAGKYQGGIKLTMTISDTKRNAEVAQCADLVERLTRF